MYDLSFEIAGPMAMFMRPHSGATPVSYPLPTGSAIKAIAESVAFVEGAWFRPMRIEICSPLRYATYTTNYGGPLRKSDQVRKMANYQLVARVLVAPCYKVYGVCVATNNQGGRDAPAKLQGMFLRRLQAGQSRFPACLGWREFSAAYFGSVRAETAPDHAVNETVEGYLLQVWSDPQNGAWAPRFVTVIVDRGICDLTKAWHDAA